MRFSVIGLNHPHIYGQVNLLKRAGGEFVAVHAPEPDLLAEFRKAFPEASLARDRREILEDGTIEMVVSAGVPADRAPLGIEVMRHGKDYMSDKPGITTLDQLAEVRRVQAETRRIYSICFSERFENAATVKAGELVSEGAIGKVIQTIGLGPHQIRNATRPPWFFDRARYGGILADIASHQCDQFLFFTGSTEARIVASRVANYKHPQHPGLEDFGDMMLEGDGGTGYVRVDWYTPDGLGTWGDGRLTILGTEGFIEVRKNCDLGGRPGGNHLFISDKAGVRHFDCKDHPLPYGRQLIADVRDRTETAMPQAHCFLATELALTAEAQARRLGNLA